MRPPTRLDLPAGAAGGMQCLVKRTDPCWKWLTTAAAVFALAVNAHADGSVADLDRDNGLPDAQLGAPVKSFQGLKNTEDTGRFQTYVRSTDKLQLEGVEVAGITYNFFKGELYSIDVDVQGAGNVRKMLKILEKKYGADHTTETRTYPKTSAQLEIREWASKRAYCLYKSASDDKGAVLVFVNRPKWDELEVPRRERENQARDRLKGSFMNGDF